MENLDRLDMTLFEKLDTEEKLNAEILRPSMSYWQDVWRRLKENRLAMAGLVTVIGIMVQVQDIGNTFGSGHRLH